VVGATLFNIAQMRLHLEGINRMFGMNCDTMEARSGKFDM
jgi:hypothetical protein